MYIVIVAAQAELAQSTCCTTTISDHPIFVLVVLGLLALFHVVVGACSEKIKKKKAFSLDTIRRSPAG